MSFEEDKRSWHLYVAVDLGWVITDTAAEVKDKPRWAIEDNWSEGGSGLEE